MKNIICLFCCLFILKLRLKLIKNQFDLLQCLDTTLNKSYLIYILLDSS